LEQSGIPADSTEAKRWGAAYDSPLATRLLDLIGLIGETQGSRISAANVQRIGQAIGIAFEMGRSHDGRYCPPYEDQMADGRGHNRWDSELDSGDTDSGDTSPNSAP
jgi:hypothetical protein